jgi:hypothetical protein
LVEVDKGTTLHFRSKKQIVIYVLTALFFIAFRTWFGAQINFYHEDYTQIYLIGLEYFSNGWSFWGPDVVWSETRLAGGLQSVLAGGTFYFTKYYLSPLILSNIISGTGLILMSLYSSYRLKINYFLTLVIVMTLPFLMHHGSVLLNTSYLLFPGAILMIGVFELFLYRDQTMFKNIAWYFFGFGFSIFFVYQLHLTWVVIVPFTLVLLALEFKRNDSSLIHIALFFFIGSVIGASFLIPTFVVKYDLMFKGMDGNLIFKPERFLQIIEVTTRILCYSTYDTNPTFDFNALASSKNQFLSISLYTIKYIGIIQLVGILIILLIRRKESLTQRIVFLLICTIVLCCCLHVMANKHLESRTFILLYGLPVFMSFYALSWVKQNTLFSATIYTLSAFLCLVYVGVGYYNLPTEHSFQSAKEVMDKAIIAKDPSEFGVRRTTKMDE